MWATKWIFINNSIYTIYWPSLKLKNIIICIFFLFLQNIMLSTYYKEEQLCLGKTAGEALVDLLIDWGVEHIYTECLEILSTLLLKL